MKYFPRHTFTFIITAIILAGCSNPESDLLQPKQDPALLDVEFTYDDYNTLLHEYVDTNGMVDYKSLQNDRLRLDAFIASLNNISKEVSDAWTQQDQLAFWINAYNAITIQYILNNYPIHKGSLINQARFPRNSIRQIDGVWTKLETNVLGSPITLDAIEHEILRPTFKDPRIHMAIVCASISCPPLRNEAYKVDNLEEQLDDQAQTFLNNPTNFRIDETKKRVYISSIFDWFGEDFTNGYNQDSIFTKFSTEENAVLAFISSYITPKKIAFLHDQSYKVSYTDYDWSLNEQ